MSAPTKPNEPKAAETPKVAEASAKMVIQVDPGAKSIESKSTSVPLSPKLKDIVLSQGVRDSDDAESND